MSAMLESFDTQMLDFQGDPDYSMQVTSSSDIWFQDEASMEDDGRTPTQNTIEVDMESYDEQQHLEYEMEDDSEPAEPDRNDILDVEVYDASRFQSPDALPDPVVPALSLDPSEPSSFAVDDNESPDTHISPEASHSADIPSDVPHHPPSPLLSGQIVESEPAPLPAEENPLSTEASHHVARSVDLEGADIPDDSPNASGVATEELLLTVVEASRLDNVPNDYEHKELAPEIEAAEGTSDAPTGFPPDQSVEEAVVEYADFEGSTGDPHEISEGVYIDPPPPVLISILIGAPSISLFNSPPKSRSNSPSQSDAPGLEVLLGQLPTLYYEPLSSVFEALRQEEFLSRVPGLLNGELLFDAYDLEVTLSEDHTFAHELSLHDLNVLHDGLNKPGPLRLRLKSIGPRFIDRYHMLQDQIAQFQLAGSTAEAEAGAPTPEDTKQPTYTPEDDDTSTSMNHREEEEHGTVNDSPHPETNVPEDKAAPTDDADNTEKNDLYFAPTDENEGGNDHLPGDNQDEEDGSPNDETEQEEDNFDPTKSGEEPAHILSSLSSNPNAESIDIVEAQNNEAYEEYEEHDEPEESGSVSNADETSTKPELTIDVGQELYQTNSLVDPSLANEGENHVVVEDASYAPEGAWDDTLDGEGDLEEEDREHEHEYEYAPEYHHDHDQEHEHETASDLSSVTLSSKSSVKRSLSEAELEGYDDEDPVLSSPDPKRTRVD